MERLSSRDVPKLEKFISESTVLERSCIFNDLYYQIRDGNSFEEAFKVTSDKVKRDPYKYSTMSFATICSWVSGYKFTYWEDINLVLANRKYREIIINKIEKELEGIKAEYVFGRREDG